MHAPFKIIVDAPGQTCNRFWSYLETIAWAMEYDRKVIILYWDSSLSDYDGLRSNEYVSFPFYWRYIINKIGHQQWQRCYSYIFSNRYVTKILALGPLKSLFVHGWHFRESAKFYPKHKSQLIELFKPNYNCRATVDSVFDSYKKKRWFIIGVHIRRGDYKTYEGGRYYYEFEEYAEIMRSVLHLFSTKKVVFFISTNEKYDTEIFEDLPLMSINTTSCAEDLYGLSKCDRIVGPLSSFSRWASFVGDVPLCFIERGKKIESDDDFSVIDGLYRFRNGKEIVNWTKIREGI